MPTKRTIITNSLIGCTLLVISFLALNLNVAQTYWRVTAPVYNGNRNGQYVALAIIIDNDTAADCAVAMPPLLTNAHSNATFFITGSTAANNLAALHTLAEQCEIGNHGFSHQNLNIADKNLISEEITLGGTLLSNLSGQAPTFFTPPNGLFNKNTLAMAESLGYRTVLPTDRPVSIDWTTADSNLVQAYATHNTQAGDIIFLHANSATLQSLAAIITNFLERDLILTSLGQLLA